MIETSTSMGPWFCAQEPHGTTGATVWEMTATGSVLIADCTNKQLTVNAQRLNARMCAAAPLMAEVLIDAFDTLSHEDADKAREILQYVFGSNRKL